MEMRRLGKSDILINPIGMGCWSFGGGDYWGRQDQDDVDNIVHKAIENGINFFDTAEMYNEGKSEQSLGIALKGIRSKVIVCSKISPSNASSSRMKIHCEESLKRLGTDYIDIYLLHWPITPSSVRSFTNDTEIIKNPPTTEEAFSALRDLQKEGKVRYTGISNFGLNQMKEALNTGADIITNELPYNILSRAIEKEIMPFCISSDISVVCSMGLQQGLLAGIYNDPSEVPPKQARSRHFNNERGAGQSRHMGEGAETEVFEVIKSLKKISYEQNISPAQLALAWILSKPGIGCVLAGSRSIKELEDNLQAGAITLDKKLIEEIDYISEPVLKKLGFNPDYYENSENGRIF